MMSSLSVIHCIMCLAALVLSVAQPAIASKSKVLLLHDSFPCSSEVFCRRLGQGIAAAGFSVDEVDGEALASRLDSLMHSGTILVLPNARYFPADAVGSLDRFLKRGNHLFAISGPILSSMVVKEDGRWMDAAPEIPLPILESLCPPYKTFTTTAAHIELVDKTERHALGGQVCISLHRSKGNLCDSLRKWRQMPFAYALNDKGKRKGIVGHLFLNASGAYARSVWGYLGLEQSDIEAAAGDYLPIIISQLNRMDRGLFLSNVGSDAFAYVQGEQTRLGAYVTNLSWKRADVRVDFKVFSGGKSMHSSAALAEVSSGSCDVAAFVPGKSLMLLPGEYVAKTTLRVGSSVVDEISHRFQVIRYDKLRKEDVVKVRDGDFYLNGKKWYPVGINYWPRYVPGLEPEDYWQQQWSPANYDPDVVEEDLSLIQNLGMNCISIQYNRLDQSRVVMDLLARASKHGLKVHLFLPGVHPLDQDFELARSLIESAHLAQSPAMFAYDLGWEVHVGPYADRKGYDSLWQRWVIDQYGDIEAAEQDWGYSPERADGIITGPKDEQLVQDGQWRVYVAAYRRFWDDEISKRYASVRKFVRSLDPNHLLGARSGYGGTGAVEVAGVLPFDLASGVKHLDYISPEAYNVRGTTRDFLKAGLTTAYGRFVSGGKPVFWAEFGIPLLLGVDSYSYRSEMSLANFEKHRDYYRNMVTAARVTGSNGCAGWWWPGGYRLGEKSDFGIIAPDGVPRPAAFELREAWRNSTPIGNPSKPDTYYAIDRDRHTSGYAGVYAEHAANSADCLAKGLVPGVKTAGTGTTSADTPLITVGNLPYNGRGPLKYLNAEFNAITVNGRPVRNGDSVEMEPGEQVFVEASVGNTGEAQWLAHVEASVGNVCLQTNVGDKKMLAGIQANTSFLSDASVPSVKLMLMPDTSVGCTFRMAAVGRGLFGETLRIVLVPKIYPKSRGRN